MGRMVCDSRVLQAGCENGSHCPNAGYRFLYNSIRVYLSHSLGFAERNPEVTVHQR